MRNKKQRDRRGFTLIELSVVLVLLALVTLMIVSFSELIGKYVHQDTGNYQFYEECAELKQTLFDLLLSEDAEGVECKVENKGLTGNSYSVSFSAETLVITKNGVSEELEFKQIDELTFEAKSDGKAVKCTAYMYGEEEEEHVQSFLIAMRCGTFQTTTGE